VHFDTEEVSSGQLKRGDPASKLADLDFDKLYPLGGPVFVKGAEPGDVLEVEILSLKPGRGAGAPSSPASGCWPRISWNLTSAISSWAIEPQPSFARTSTPHRAVLRNYGRGD